MRLTRLVAVVVAVTAWGCGAVGSCIPCDGKTSHGFPIPGTCCTAVAANVTWTGSCKSMTAKTWGSVECWSPRVPTEEDVVLVGSGEVTMDSLEADNTTVALVVKGLVVGKGATLTMRDGVLVVRDEVVVLGRLLLEAPAMAVNPGVSNAATALEADLAAEEQGLRDCYQIPTGFTPRVCGTGVVVVAEGGVLETAGLYASMFAAVQVQRGGEYRMGAKSFLWKDVTVEGKMTVSTPDWPLGDVAYWHGSVFVQPGGVLDMTGAAVQVDGWGNATLWVERFERPAVESKGTVLAKQALLLNTQYVYYRGTLSEGTYKGRLVNHPNATLTVDQYTQMLWEVSGTGRVERVSTVTARREGKKREVANREVANREDAVWGRVAEGVTVVNLGRLEVTGSVAGIVVNNGSLTVRGDVADGGLVVNHGGAKVDGDVAGDVVNHGVLEMRGEVRRTGSVVNQ
eukprot:Sspe_Gene.94057::Locus_66532_Transcript_1_1_Confidence_1.000_Length_1409::g.94057::m.94057